jgi:hypothetical protein
MSKSNLKIITLKKNQIDDFSSERNDLLRKAKAKWVFFLDSDEEMREDLKKEIEEAVRSEKFNGYYVYRKNFFLGKFIGKDKIIRLAKKAGGRWKRSVHEKWEIKGETGTLKNFLIHNTSPSLNDYIDKINKYSVMHSEANRLEGKKSNLIKIVIYPKIKFIQSLLMGRGVVFSILQAFHSFLAWSNLWLTQRNENK